MSNGRNANHVTLPAVCDHAALRPHCLFWSSAFGPVGVTAVPDRMHARMFTQMCRTRRWRGRGPTAAYMAMSTLREKGEEEEGRTPVAAAFTKLRARPWVCVVLCYSITSFWQIPSGCTAHATSAIVACVYIILQWGLYNLCIRNSICSNAAGKNYYTSRHIRVLKCTTLKGINLPVLFTTDANEYTVTSLAERSQTVLLGSPKKCSFICNFVAKADGVRRG